MSSPTLSPPKPDPARIDPIDALVPPLRPWWARLTLASLTIGLVGLLGWCWQFGVLRPSPDCCGSGSSGTQIGLSNRPGAVTVSVYFFNSSPRPVTIEGASAELPGARVVEVAPYADRFGFEMPPQNLSAFPQTVDGTSSLWLAVSFEPEQCDSAQAADGEDWGTVTLDLSVAGDHWYPTLGRSFLLPEPVVAAGPDQLGILQPSSMDHLVDNGGPLSPGAPPLALACTLLGR